MIELVWTGDVGELRIKKEFVTADVMIQLDGLQDWITELQELYEFMGDAAFSRKPELKTEKESK